MLYEVRVVAHSGGDPTRFELDREEPLKEGEYLPQMNMVYQVVRVLPGEGKFDAIVEPSGELVQVKRHNQP